MTLSQNVLLEMVAAYPRPTAVVSPGGSPTLNQAARAMLAAMGLMSDATAPTVEPAIVDWVQELGEELLSGGESAVPNRREFGALSGPQVLSAAVAPAREGADDTMCALVSLDNVTGVKLAECGLPLASRLLELFNRFRPGPETYQRILQELKAFTGVEAVGLRLVEGEDYPYYFTNGFDNEFVEAEKHLCVKNEDGECLRDEDGSPLLECMCGNIIRGRTDPAQSFFTGQGSFWSNNTTHLLATTSEEDRQARTRNRCNAEGYETVVLIPLKSDEKVVGLMQFNDRRMGRMSADMLRFLEGLGASIGIALARNREQEILARQAEELRRSNEDLRQFAAVASHDLQEPLRTITGFGQLLDRRHSVQLSEDGQKMVHYMVDGASRMQNLVRDLLAYSRVEGRGKPFEHIDCDAVLDGVRESLEAVLAESGGRLLGGGLPTIQGDPNQILQLFLNLASNGLKFRKEGIPPVVEVSAARTEEGWVFKFSDNGIGIAPEYHTHVFEMFKRLHSKDSYSGTGIGLSICRKIVERHGGRIWVESESGKGATFCFVFPAA